MLSLAGRLRKEDRLQRCIVYGSGRGLQRTRRSCKVLMAGPSRLHVCTFEHRLCHPPQAWDSGDTAVWLYVLLKWAQSLQLQHRLCTLPAASPTFSSSAKAAGGLGRAVAVQAVHCPCTCIYCTHRSALPGKVPATAGRAGHLLIDRQVPHAAHAGRPLGDRPAGSVYERLEQGFGPVAVAGPAGPRAGADVI